jgi:hypothetical protein
MTEPREAAWWARGPIPRDGYYATRCALSVTVEASDAFDVTVNPPRERLTFFHEGDEPHGLEWRGPIETPEGA